MLPAEASGRPTHTESRSDLNYRLIAVLWVIAGTVLAAQTPPAVPVPALTQPVPAATSQNAREILARVRPSVIQIKGFFGSNTAQAFHGTGFAVAADGVFMTNYHVVAQKIQYPEKYRLEYRTPDGATGAVQVLAVDVRHDLAVVQAEKFSPPPLTLQPTVPVKGDRAFSVGFPLDVGLTITEGVSNGRVEDSFDPRIHYSGALNGGMSGGPALDASGAVIGVNVAGYRFEQLVSFLVPAEHGLTLLQKARQTVKDLRADVQAQMRAHAADLLKALDGDMPTQVAAGYALPAKLAPFVDCSASADPSTEQPVQTLRIACSAKAGLYVEQGQFTGDLRYSHYVLTSERLDAWRFAHRLTALTGAAGAFGSRKYVGPFVCESDTVTLTGFDAAALVCVRSHRRLPGLYDFTVRVSSLNQSRRGFASHLDMYGVGFEAGSRFVRRYIESMRWQP